MTTRRDSRDLSDSGISQIDSNDIDKSDDGSRAEIRKSSTSTSKKEFKPITARDLARFLCGTTTKQRILRLRNLIWIVVVVICAVFMVKQVMVIERNLICTNLQIKAKQIHIFSFTN